MRNFSMLMSCFLCTGFLGTATQSLSAEDLIKTDGAILNVPPKSFKWVGTPDGVAFASLLGDRFTEPYMAMVRLPAGLVSPAHMKSANMFGVLISGRMIHSTIEADPADDIILTAGSFYKIPANVAHISKCVSDIECVTFLYQDGKFDFLQIVR